MTLIGRQPQYIDSGIYQQPLIGSCFNFKLRLLLPNHSRNGHEKKMTLIGGQHQNI